MWCIVFVCRMLTKDYSLSKKEGWGRYEQKTWMLVPKLFNSEVVSFVIYAGAIVTIWFALEHGGIERTIKLFM